MPVAVVTDSTAYLPAELAGSYELTVVPLTVVINGRDGLEGTEIHPAEFAQAVHKIRSVLPAPLQAPRWGIICGSGLSTLGSSLVDSVEIPYSDIPGFAHIGGAQYVTGWNSAECGTCYRLDYKGNISAD